MTSTEENVGYKRKNKTSESHKLSSDDNLKDSTENVNSFLYKQPGDYAEALNQWILQYNCWNSMSYYYMVMPAYMNNYYAMQQQSMMNSMTSSRPLDTHQSNASGSINTETRQAQSSNNNIAGMFS